MKKLLISSCLLGENVRYDGKIKKCMDPLFYEIIKSSQVFPICPEVDGGLPTPRAPSEIVSLNPLKIVNNKGEDVTFFFENGAKKALQICKKNKIKVAILKSKSPSCSNSLIYDGTFSGNLIKGEGITAKLLRENNIKVFNENELEALLECLKNI